MKTKIEVNGFKIPGEFGAVALWKALFNVLNNPGISQTYQLQDAANFSSLNHSTLGWLTSPGPKSPAEKLWDRRKEGVFCLYPNQWTQKAFDLIPHPDTILTEYMKSRARKCPIFKEGDNVTERIGDQVRKGTFLRYIVANPRQTYNENGNYGLVSVRRENSFESIEEIVATTELQPFNNNPKFPLYSIQNQLEASFLVDGCIETTFLQFLSHD
jgi:hypothetical protein